MLRIIRPQGINQPCSPGSPHPPIHRRLTGPSSVLKSTHCLLGLSLCMCHFLLRALLSPLPLANFLSSPSLIPNALVPESSLTPSTRARSFLEGLGDACAFPLFTVITFIVSYVSPVFPAILEAPQG